ncbi:MAG: 5-formyltetrahydrofolate cyclo-ligase [Eubacterium sp.]|nr:5-formyltetrahydrofolate cyclo-ligase [Eubacterium sp.]
MSVKSELRKEYKIIRKNVQNKVEKDKLINKYLLNFELFDKCNQVLFYAALDDEVNLDLSVKKSLEKEKKVALPVCIDNRGKMQYYYIRSFDDIEVGAFGVREPKVDFCKPLDSFSNAICIVPAIAFDKSGYRLGYGKGYYDRFLSKFNGISIGVSYDECIAQNICADSFDIPVDYIITQSGVLSIKQGGKNG